MSRIVPVNCATTNTVEQLTFALTEAFPEWAYYQIIRADLLSPECLAFLLKIDGKPISHKDATGKSHLAHPIPRSDKLFVGQLIIEVPLQFLLTVERHDLNDQEMWERAEAVANNPCRSRRQQPYPERN